MIRLLALPALLALLGCGLSLGPASLAFADEQLSFTSKDSILVISPHPDDETLCCAGVIQRARTAGARVAVVWVTGGDAFELDARLVEHRLRPGRDGLLQLGMRRAAEAVEAGAALGLNANERYLLGYPDRGIQHLALDNFYTRYRSPFTGASEVFLQGALSPHAPYEGQALLKDLASVIDRQQPNYVFAASPLDAHPDHRFSGELVIRLMAERRQLDRVYYWIVHGGFDWPRPRGLHPDRRLVPPARARNLEWLSFQLSPAEQQTKLAALQAHRSQMEIMRPFLEAFVRQNELFTRAAAAEAAAAPSLSPESSIIAQPDSQEMEP